MTDQVVRESNSELTIYVNTVKDAMEKSNRDSSSSSDDNYNEGLTSDESIDAHLDKLRMEVHNAIDDSLSDEERKRGEDNRKRVGRDNFTERQVEETMEQKADRLVRDAEQAKARIFQTPGC